MAWMILRMQILSSQKPRKYLKEATFFTLAIAIKVTIASTLNVQCFLEQQLLVSDIEIRYIPMESLTGYYRIISTSSALELLLHESSIVFHSQSTNNWFIRELVPVLNNFNYQSLLWSIPGLMAIARQRVCVRLCVQDLSPYMHDCRYFIHCLWVSQRNVLCHDVSSCDVLSVCLRFKPS